MKDGINANQHKFMENRSCQTKLIFFLDYKLFFKVILLMYHTLQAI